ncbi:fungal-specific transcription factor domain-containing protein [Geopyxis carbonaria]|nr:fungal-specific transcription factor domain-containing protein [Geopyxis carbonaria]
MDAIENSPSYQSTGTRNSHKNSRRSPSEGLGDGDETADGPRLYHTLTACTRCRSRKTRCDAGLPKCGPCERSRSHCEFFDSTKKKTISRSYVVHLQNKVLALEEEIKRRESQLVDSEGPNSEELVRGIGAVKFGDYEHYKEPRYVGPSSGVTVTRLVLESAKKDLKPEEFKDMTTEHRHTFKNTMRTEPIVAVAPDLSGLSTTPQPNLPPRNFGEKLVSFFCQRSLYMLPILHEPTFLKEVADVYDGSTNPFKTFKLKMVLAISLQKYSIQYAAVADGYFLSGLQDLEEILDPMDHRTLQCLLVMVQYALVKPTRIAAYHIVGLCVRLCIQLGYHQERTIMLSETPLDPITKDMRRRMFWTLASMEYGLSQVLGRPSAFATSDAHIDVKFYEPVDDRYITAEGILPAPHSTKKLISMHFFAMRRLQAEIRHTLYQNPRETPKTDKDPWFQQMFEKCAKWKASCPQDDEGSGLGEICNSRYNNIIIFMYRPSPQVPQPSLEATLTCYKCAVENVYLEKKMFDERAVDLTWVFMHQIYTVTLTIIWAIYNPEIRKRYAKQDLQRHMKTQIKLLMNLDERWPGAEAAADLFKRLAKAALKNYDLDIKKSPKSTHDSVPATSSPPAPQKLHPEQSSPQTMQNSPYPRSEGSWSLGDTPSPNANMPSFSSTYSPPRPQDPSGGDPFNRDIQGMMADPNLMNAMFFNVGSAPNDEANVSGVHRFLHPYPTNGPDLSGYPPEPQIDFGPPTNIGTLPPAVRYPGTSGEGVPMLNSQSQHDELMNILRNEAIQGYGFPGVQEPRAWGYDESPYF